MHIWIGRRDQARQVGDKTLGDFLDPHRERETLVPDHLARPEGGR